MPVSEDFNVSSVYRKLLLVLDQIFGVFEDVTWSGF